jgi:hypothetical protein
MLDLLLSIPDMLLTMGLPAIDQSLDKLLAAMETFPKAALMGDAVGFARVIGLCLALCMGSYECWMMMLGKRGMDVMKLLRIVGLSMCITSSTWICNQLLIPGKALENTTKTMAVAKNKQVAALELKVAEKQDGYLKRLRAIQDSLSTAKQVQAIGEDAHWWDKLIYNMQNLGDTINDYAQRAAVLTETKASEWINDIIRFIGELIFQMSYYGMLVAQRIFLTIMAMFAPIMFAMSLVPPFSNAWSSWMSKYLSLSLWGFVVYMCLYYIDFILMYNLQEDITAYDALLKGNVTSWSSIGALGLQGIGSNCMYAMGMLVGAYVIRFVPEVASWLIPGGVSSSAAQTAGAVAAGMVGGAASGAATGAMTVAGGAVMGSAAIVGAAQQAHSDGGGILREVGRTIMSQTPIGQSYSRGADSARSMNNVGTSDSNYTRGGTSTGAGGGGSSTNTSDRNYDYDE